MVPATDSFKELEGYAWDNCRGDFSACLWTGHHVERVHKPNLKYYQFEFVDENDAILFKLRWIGNADG